MRELKFRIWYPRDKCMSQNLSVFNLPDIDDLKKHCQCDFKIMQYTGLKDKNNKEIYDGDTINDVYGKAKVEWQDHSCRFVLVAFNKIYPLDTIVSNQCEIIGNIYEKPELLKGGG